MVKNAKRKAIVILFSLIGIACIGFAAYTIYNVRNTPVPTHTRHINTDIVNIAVTSAGNQRTVAITIQETGERATITTTVRTVRRRRPATTAPSAPRQTVHHDGNIVRIYSVSSLLVVYEKQTGVRHYI